MKYRRLGATDLEVSILGFGVWTVSTNWWGVTDPSTAKRLIDQALDLGVNFFDTAETYGDGRGETLLAETLARVRDQVIIATKGGYDLSAPARADQRERPQDMSPAALRRGVEASLKRLATDRIDLYQLHNPKMEHILADETFSALEALRAEGLIRWWGIALGPRIGWRDEGLLAIRRRQAPALQTIFNLLEPKPGQDLIQAARETGCGIHVRVPHASGLLEGRYRKGEEKLWAQNDHRRHRPAGWVERGLPIVEDLRFLETAGRTIAQAALQYVWSQPMVASALPNVYDSGQLREFAAAVASPALTVDEIARAEEVAQPWQEAEPAEQVSAR